MADDDLRSAITTNSECRPWTREDWLRCFEAAKHHPGFSPGPTVMHPDEFARRVAAGEITADGHWR